MFWYVIILLLLTFVIVIEKKSRRLGLNIDKAALQILCFLLLFFMALRGKSVGADTGIYCDVFESGDFTSRLEAGYVLFNRVLRLFFSHPQTITIANSFLLILFLYKAVRKLSPIPELSIWLYVTMCIYQSQMNLMRNAIAVMMCYAATQYIYKRQPFKYCALVLLATSFHFSSLVFLPLYWLARNVRLNNRKLLLALFSLAILSVFIQPLTKRFSFLIPERYQIYLYEALNGRNVEVEKLLVEAFIIFMTLVVVVHMEKADRPRLIRIMEQMPVVSWIILLSMLLIAFSAYGTRISALYGFYVFIFIPQLIDNMVGNEQRKKNLIVLISFLSLAQYLIRMSINNIGHTMPYVFFWQ